MLTSRRPVRKRLRHGFAPDRKPPQNGFEVVADLGPQAIEVIEVEQTLNGIPQRRRLELRIATSTAHQSAEVRDPGELLDDLAEAGSGTAAVRRPTGVRPGNACGTASPGLEATTASRSSPTSARRPSRSSSLSRP